MLYIRWTRQEKKRGNDSRYNSYTIVKCHKTLYHCLLTNMDYVLDVGRKMALLATRTCRANWQQHKETHQKWPVSGFLGRSGHSECEPSCTTQDIFSLHNDTQWFRHLSSCSRILELKLYFDIFYHDFVAPFSNIVLPKQADHNSASRNTLRRIPFVHRGIVKNWSQYNFSQQVAYSESNRGR